MIQVPAGFDYMMFISNLLSAAMPFISIAVLIAAYVLILKAFKRM